MTPADQLLDLAAAMSLSVIVCMAIAVAWCWVVDLWDWWLEARIDRVLVHKRVRLPTQA